MTNTQTILKKLFDNGIDIEGGMLIRKTSLELTSRSKISLNISLNSEWNLRVFEATANGALLMSDRLSPFTGLSSIYKEGEAAVYFDNTDDLIKKLRYYSANEEEASRIAQSGKAITEKLFSRESRKQAVLHVMETGELPVEYQAFQDPRGNVPAASDEAKNLLLRRIQIYEVVQELHRKNEKIRLCIGENITPLLAFDLCDLPRAEVIVQMEEEEFQGKYGLFLKYLGLTNITNTQPRNEFGEDYDLTVLSLKQLTNMDNRELKRLSSFIVLDYPQEDNSILEQLSQCHFSSVENSILGHFKNQKG